tara:strand:- start:933 stop:2243 length:1311 start_codon:yes stop_codon:yes gene_type:complete
MKNLINKYQDYILISFFFLLIIFGRPFVGLYVFGIRLGELLVAYSFIAFFYFIIKKNSFPDKFKNLFTVLVLIFLSFLFSNIFDEGFYFSEYLFKSSSYIWTVSFLFLGYIYKIKNQYLPYILSGSLFVLYIFNTVFYPKIFIDLLTNNADKFELTKASNMLIVVIFVNVINYFTVENTKFINYYFIFSTSFYLPLLLFNSRGSFLSLAMFIILFLIYKKDLYLENLRSTLIFLAIFTLSFIVSTYNIFGELDFSKRAQKESIEISSVSDNLNKLVDNKNTINVFFSFYVYEGRLYSRDGTTDWRLDIWQDVVEDLNKRDKILLGYGYSSIIPVMVDPEAPGRLGEDGLNENVHNYAVTILSRGGLTQLLLFIYFHYKLFIIYRENHKNNFFLVLIIPAFFNAFLDVAMESVQFPIMYYALAGFLLSSKEYLNNKL